MTGIFFINLCIKKIENYDAFISQRLYDGIQFDI